MAISSNIDKYLNDSLINSQVCRFSKQNINIYVTPIFANISESEKYNYYNLIQTAINIWNQYAPVKFSITNSAQNSDIVINWTKVGIKNEGMCKYRSIVASEIKAVTIDLGLPNPYSQKIVNNSTILHTILHELGHAMGLGHGVIADDLMFVPHQKTLNQPSENDLYILKTLYSNPIGTNSINIIKP